MTISEQVTKNIIKKLLNGEDYRIEVVTLIDAEFLQFAIEFFKKVVSAKLKNQNITIDWYKAEFLSDSLDSENIAINAGLNKKTISNMYNTARREIVIEASYLHYEQFSDALSTLIEDEREFNLSLSIKFRTVSVELNISESLIVINTLAVKRSALRGGLWSTAGKRVEKPLMLTLCKLFGVSNNNYSICVDNKALDHDYDFEREIDFYLVQNNNNYKCEVKLMGKGNPESADVVIARGSKVFIADKLSDTNKNQLDSLGVEWLEFRSADGYKKFKNILKKLGIPFTKDGQFNDNSLNDILMDIFGN
jgi:hypothetical protein